LERGLLGEYHMDKEDRHLVLSECFRQFSSVGDYRFHVIRLSFHRRDSLLQVYYD